MNVRRFLYFTYHRLTGSTLPELYRQFHQQDREGLSEQATSATMSLLLWRLLAHCRESVPYYAELMAQHGQPSVQEVREYLGELPILTKQLIRSCGDRLVSSDVSHRKTHLTSSGGSTGEPIRLLQDQQYWDQTAAIQMLHSSWAHGEFGRPEIYVWGSERDIERGTMGLRMNVVNWLSRRRYLNAFQMSPRAIADFIGRINRRPPRLIVAYAQSIYEIACVAERDGLLVRPQRAIVVTSETLHDFMREKVEAVFGCRVFNRYGSREVGDIAGECTEHDGLHVFPWGSYVEVVDDSGRPVPDGVEGNLVVTSLANFAMPLVRYWIGDRGMLAARRTCRCGRTTQLLQSVSGHSGETFRRSDGVLMDGGYFSGLMYFRNWVLQFQVIQWTYTELEFKIVTPPGVAPPREELADIERKVKRVMGPACTVRFSLEPEIPPLPSGKRTYTISHL